MKLYKKRPNSALNSHFRFATRISISVQLSCKDMTGRNNSWEST